MSVATAFGLVAVLAGPGATQTDAPAPRTSDPPAPHVREDGSRSGRVHLQLDSDATWGIGGQMFLGSHLRLAGLLEHWSTNHAMGTWDGAIGFAYQNQPTFLAPWLDSTQITGAGHRVQLTAGVGHTIHMGARRRSALGLHAFGGWNFNRSAYRVEYADEDVSGRAVVDHHRPIVGVELRFNYRFHRRVGLNFMIGAPLPTVSSYLISIGQLGLGLSFHLR